jgi:hypothetical protein
MAEIQFNGRPGSRAQNACKGDLFKIIQADHVDKMTRGVDRYGKPRAPLAASTLANKRRGPGPSLIPRGSRSRFITNFVLAWEEIGGTGVSVLVGKFVNIVNKKGQSFAQYHLTGATRRGTKWVLPKRDVSGITPKGWAAVERRHAQLPADILRMGG